MITVRVWDEFHHMRYNETFTDATEAHAFADTYRRSGWTVKEG